MESTNGPTPKEQIKHQVDIVMAEMFGSVVTALVVNDRGASVVGIFSGILGAGMCGDILRRTHKINRIEKTANEA